MIRDTGKLSQATYDLLVIGGGINGAAIANVAAGRGLKTVLVEKKDFASGTSSKSTKLIHGGIRYLENLEFDLVYEALHERYRQIQSAPHLVKPISFVIPVYQGDKRPLWMMRLGVFLYDFLAGPYKIGQHKYLSREELIDIQPDMKRDGLLGGVVYYDAQMDDARLCLENVLTASVKGADVANYIEATSFIKEAGKVVGINAHDVIYKQDFQIRAKKIICTVGPWTNVLLRMDDPQAKKKIRTTKGIHIVYKEKITEYGFLIQSGSDNRIFFIIPFMGHSLIGTTDTDCIDSPDAIEAEQSDIEYLFTEMRRIFPTIDFKKENIVTTFAGLRPLVRRGGMAPSNVSRKHVLFKTKSGIHFVIGGKYTTYRKIAIDCVNALTNHRNNKAEKEYLLYGSGKVPQDIDALAKQYALKPENMNALLEKYGSRYQDVLKIADIDPELKERFCTCNPFIKAQIVYAIKTEMAQTTDDILTRRLALTYQPCHLKECEKVINHYILKLCPQSRNI